MKKIEGLTKEDREAIIEVLEQPNPKMDTTIKDIRKIDKVCTVLEGDGVDFEDADFEYMKMRLSGYPGWIGKGRKEVIRIFDLLGIE